MKRTIISIITAIALLITTSVVPVAYAMNDKNIYENTNTVEYISKVLGDYLKSENKSLEEGTPEYVEYLVDMLMFKEDEEIKKIEEYQDILTYAANYIVYYKAPFIDSDGNIDPDYKVVKIPKEMQNKTISQLKVESKNIDGASYLYPEINKNNIVQTAAYSPSKAANYAYEHAYDRTDQAYGYFSGANCTNFVSQAVKAGGKSMTLPSNINNIGPGAYSSNNYWFNKFYDAGGGTAYHKVQKYSTGWITVAGFYFYWSRHNAKTMEYTTRKVLEQNLKVGDIVQLYDGNRWYHSIIIYGKNPSNEWTYCGHTNHAREKSIKNVSANKYRIIRIS